VLVNTVVIGNYTQPNVGVMVPGILAAGTFNGNPVNLLPYFTGGLQSTNRGGSSGVSVNFLDGGGADPLKNNKPANSESSSQYFLLTHLYSFFGALLGCSQYGMGAFPSYSGRASMYETHKFMDLDASEVGYFIQQVALAAMSFGVADADIQAVGTALGNLFNVKCGPPTTVIPGKGPQLQSICTDDTTCKLSANATCDQYSPAMPPMSSNSTSTATSSKPAGSGTSTTLPTGTSMTMGSSTGTAKPSNVVSTAGVAATGVSFVAVIGGLAALIL